MRDIDLDLPVLLDLPVDLVVCGCMFLVDVDIYTAQLEA